MSQSAADKSPDSEFSLGTPNNLQATNDSNSILVDENNNLNEIEKKVSAKIKENLGDKIFNNWFTGLRVEKVNGDIAHITLPTAFLRSWIMKNYPDGVSKAFREVIPNIAKLEFHVRTPAKNHNPAVSKSGIENQIKRAANPVNVNYSAQQREDIKGLMPDMVFDKFLKNATNEFAFAAAQQIVNKYPEAVFNPLTICGSIGVGKTHLLNAIGYALSEKTNGRHLLLSSVSFVQEFANSMTNRSTHHFRAKFDNIDLLLVDDIAFLSEKEAFAREFLDLLNKFLDSGRQVITTSSISPSKEMGGFDERLRSRLNGGLVVTIEDADFDLRRRFILEQSRLRKEKGQGIVFNEDVVEYIAKNVTGNLRELMGAINRLIVNYHCNNDRVTIGLATNLLRDLVQKNSSRKLSIEVIQKTVADHFDISVADIISSRRTRSIARPRQIAMYLTKQLTTRSYPEIGRMFGGKDHTTIIHAHRRVVELREKESSIDNEVRILIEQLTQL